MADDVTIARLGAQGHGVIDTADGPRFVPFALPGERVRERSEGLPELLSEPSPGRAVAVCRHFGVCGGCVAQHMRDEFYADWKRTIVVDAFGQRGLQPDIAPLVRIAPGSRRRAVFTARRESGSAVLGYHRRRTHSLFAVEECPVLLPDIVARLPALRTIAAALPGRETRLTVLATTTGLDVAVEGDKPARDGRLSTELARIAAQERIARISLNGETLIARVTPAISLSGVDVIPPPGAFVQAVAEAETAMAARVQAAVGKARRFADLFCGLGAFTLPLARSARVLSVDSDQAAIAALGAGVQRAQGLKPVETLVRDLFREPLSAKEMGTFDAVVLDPPRSGARTQCEELGRSKVPRVVYVSCNPATLARDARTLVDGGYAIASVTPIDQFLWSAHVETVAVFTRP